MKKRLKNAKFRTLTIAIMIPVILITGFSVLLTSYIGYRKALLHQISRSRVDVLGMQSEEIDNVLMYMTVLINLFYYSDEIDDLTAMSGQDLTDEVRAGFNDSFRKMGTQYKNTLSNLNADHYIVIHLNNGYNFISDQAYQDTYDFNQFEDSEYYTKMSERRFGITIMGPYDDQVDPLVTKKVIILGRIIYGLDNEKIGYMYLCMEEPNVRELYLEKNYRGSIYLINEDGTILSSNDTDAIGGNYDRLFSGEDLSEDYLVTSYTSEKTGLNITEHLPQTDIFQPIYTTTQKIVLICVIETALLLFVVLYITGIFSKTISSLSSRINQMRNSSDNVDFTTDGCLELAQVGDALNDMQERIRQQTEQLKKREEIKRKTEIRLLQTQLNPHFIYNTIFSARCLIDLGKSSDASDMLTEFIALLRWNFRTRTSMVPLTEALQYIGRYIQIMKYRFADNFTVEYTIDNEAESGYVPNMMFQPVVENAILHGIAQSEKQCVLNIRVEKQDGRMIASVSNNGLGMTAEEKEKFERAMRDPSETHGMNNIYQQLKAFFGDRFRIRIDSSPEQGTTVTISIPFIDRYEVDN